jgi:hypothetical protein
VSKAEEILQEGSWVENLCVTRFSIEILTPSISELEGGARWIWKSDISTTAGLRLTFERLGRIKGRAVISA